MDTPKYNPAKDLEQEQLEQEFQSRVEDRAIEVRISELQNRLIIRRHARSYRVYT